VTNGIANPRHTIGLLAGLIALAIAGASGGPIAEWSRTLATPHARLLLYAKILVLQWSLFFYVWIGLRISLRDLVDPSTAKTRRWQRYSAVAVGAAIAWMMIGAALSAVLHPSAADLRGLMAMLPKSALERTLWILFSLGAGICEEIAYRGYLVRQLQTWSGSVTIALLLQAIVYALAHLALPIEMVVSVALLGLLLGAIAVWQKSLVPGMVVHAAIGVLAALTPPG
jgi:membrane protease YdiL (CAAX protease family)